MECLLLPSRPPNRLDNRIHTGTQADLSSNTNHNAFLSHWSVLHSLPRAARGFENDFMLCCLALWNRITMSDMNPMLCSKFRPSGQWLIVPRQFKASGLCRNWPHSCRSWPGYVFFQPPTSGLISTLFCIPSFSRHVLAYLPPLWNISS